MTARPLVWKRLGHPHRGAGAAVLAGVALGVAALALADGGDLRRVWPLVAGTLFGISLQRGELSFVRAWRDLIVLKDAGQLLAFVAALAVASALTLGGLAGAGMTDPPPGSRIAPVSWALPVAAFLFGLGSVAARGSLMVHLRRLAEGSLVALPALAATFIGVMIAMITWPWVYAHALAGAPALWLPAIVGAPGALGLELAVLAIAAAALRRFSASDDPPAKLPTDFVAPWPPVAAGALVGLVAAASYAAGEPLGLTSECAAVARWLATALGLVPHEMPGLDQGIGGLFVPLRGLGFSGHVVIVTGVLFGALSAALSSGRFALDGMTAREAVEMAAGGLLIGWGGMTALGTITGAGVSGVAIGAVSGWIFLVFASAGVIVGLMIDPRPEMTAPEPPLRDPRDDSRPQRPSKRQQRRRRRQEPS